jgi:ribosomal protein S6--L-glutamate ligase
MKLAILGPGKGSIGYTTNRLLEEGRKVFKRVDLIPIIEAVLKVEKDIDVLYENKSLNDYDYILPRIDSKRAVIGYPVVRFLDSMNVKKPYVSETVLIAHNKFLTLQNLVERGVPVPKTYLTASRKSARKVVEKEKLPIILKLLSGFGGQGVMFIESKEAVNTTIDAMRILKQEILLEKYIDNPGEDIRGIVAGDEIIASFKRIAKEGEKRANIYSGGRAVSFKLNSEMEEIVFKSAEAIKSKICAVDMLQDRKGNVFVIEVNINPGIKGIEKATNINVAQRIIDFVHSEIKR